MKSSISLITAGAFGVPDVIEELKIGGVHFYTLSELVERWNDSIEEDILSHQAWGLHINNPFTREELLKESSTDSNELDRAVAPIFTPFTMFLRRAFQHTLEPTYHTTGYLVGHEYGLALVPMQAHLREEMRRMSYIINLAKPFVHSYHISFSQNFNVPVFKTPLPTPVREEVPPDSERPFS